jgi:hypothetical protein
VAQLRHEAPRFFVFAYAAFLVLHATTARAGIVAAWSWENGFEREWVDAWGDDVVGHDRFRSRKQDVQQERAVKFFAGGMRRRLHKQNIGACVGNLSSYVVNICPQALQTTSPFHGFLP